MGIQEEQPVEEEDKLKVQEFQQVCQIKNEELNESKFYQNFQEHQEQIVPNSSETTLKKEEINHHKTYAESSKEVSEH